MVTPREREGNGSKTRRKGGNNGIKIRRKA
jgi:hypothetical protein